jgi:hypothetical protein
LAAGAVLLGVGQVRAGTAATATSYSQFEAQANEVRALRIGGAVTISAGALLLVSGIARAIVVARRAPRALSRRNGDAL